MWLVTARILRSFSMMSWVGGMVTLDVLFLDPRLVDKLDGVEAAIIFAFGEVDPGEAPSADAFDENVVSEGTPVLAQRGLADEASED